MLNMASTETRFFRYLPVNQRDRDWGLFVGEAGHTHIGPNTRYPPPGHPPDFDFSVERGRILRDYQVVYITRGFGRFESKSAGAARISAGDVFMLFPGEWHRYWPDEDTGWDEYWVGFDGGYAHRLVERGFFSPGSPLFQVGHDEMLLGLFKEIVDSIKAGPRGYHQTIAAITIQILARLSSAAFGGDACDTRTQEVIQQAKCIMTESVSDIVDVEDLAKRLGVSYSWFRRAFKNCTGFSPHQYLMELRIKNAKFLLDATNNTIKEISGRLGFQSPFYFSRIFKRKTGYSPKAWRSHTRF